MTVPSDVNKHIYSGNGVTRVWPYTFPLYDAAHLQVWVKYGSADSALLEGGYVLNEAEKTVTFPQEGTGENALSENDQIILMRVVPVLQELDLPNHGQFFAEDIETELDLIVMMIQQITETLNRAVVAPVDQTGSDDAYERLMEAVERAEEARDEAKAYIDAALAEVAVWLERAKSYAEEIESRIDEARAWAEAACACAQRVGEFTKEIQDQLRLFYKFFVITVADGLDSTEWATVEDIWDGGNSSSWADSKYLRDGQASMFLDWYDINRELLELFLPNGITDISPADEDGMITITVETIAHTIEV